MLYSQHVPDRYVSIGIMIRGGRSQHWNYCLAIIHDTGARTVTGLVHGLSQGEISTLKECVEASKDHVDIPVLVPLILIELKIQYFALLLEHRASGLADIEFKTGMRHGFSEDSTQNASARERCDKRADLDYDLITQQLTGLVGTFAFCDLTLDAGLRSLDLIERILNEDQEAPLPYTSLEPLRLRINYLKGLVLGAQSSRSLLERRTQAQVQTLYSLIAQKDADTSLRIARDGLRNNADMRVIAWVTLVFLPATFTAVNALHLRFRNIS